MNRRHAVTALLAATVALANCDNPSNTGYAGGGRSNVDPAMQRMAQDARPLIQGLDRCKQQYRSYPPNPEAMMGCLPHGAPMRREGSAVVVGEWRISPDPSGEGYTMTRHVDARAMLVWHCGRSTCRWVYDPGDGRPSLEMNLGA
jgi:hypothetical protein